MSKKSGYAVLFRQVCAVSLSSQISALCTLTARSPCICSRLRVALRFAQVPTGHTLPFGAGGGRRKVALLAQGCRIRRACQRGRPPAGSGQPVPRSRGIPSPNRRFGEGTRDSDLTSEGYGSRSLNRRGGRWPRPPLVSLPPVPPNHPKGWCHPKMVAVGRSGPCPQLIRCRPRPLQNADAGSVPRLRREPSERRAQRAQPPRKRFERPCGARNAASGRQRRIPPELCTPRRPSEAPPRAPAPVAEGASPRPPLAPCARTSPATRTAPPRTATLTTPEPTFPHPPSEVWRAAALQNAFRIQRHARWIRQPCVSKATLRRPPPGEVNGAAVDEVGGRRNSPAEKIGASRAFSTRVSGIPR